MKDRKQELALISADATHAFNVDKNNLVTHEIITQYFYIESLYFFNEDTKKLSSALRKRITVQREKKSPRCIKGTKIILQSPEQEKLFIAELERFNPQWKKEIKKYYQFENEKIKIHSSTSMNVKFEFHESHETIDAKIICFHRGVILDLYFSKPAPQEHYRLITQYFYQEQPHMQTYSHAERQQITAELIDALSQQLNTTLPTER